MRALSPLIAYGCRSCSPLLKRFLSCNHRRLPLFYTLSSFPHNHNLSHLLLTGNSLFFCMEGYLFQGVWIFCVLLLISDGSHCSLISDNVQVCTCPRALDLQALPIVTQNIQRLWSGSGINQNKAMVENLQHYGVISSKKVAEVMETVDRALFVPDGTPPYVDSPMSIGYNATISAPHMHATCLQLLEKNLQPGMHALDVGSGTGYLTACFAVMVGKEGCAVGVEHIPELVASSIKNIEKSAAAPLLEQGSLSIHVGDGRLGWQELAPYDAIHVGAAAPDIPQALVDQLKPGGRMVIPVGNIFQDLKVVDKNLDGSISIHNETSVRYVPLTSRDSQLRGY
ncbi:protein-L-isoaspartate O-methyltransferase 1-like isoform X1 [Carica papaya]|uniref:protein-L-isoaspartate O-methyltransferase 1-like isoform X1 n=2 Tax=Carica papaya TaxID=3649 RepID=UPI000B8CB693|nr:protein-L-isoaspartate O-methyltransferase 1-like isoform X1 [Carica papaya]